jgi:XTP/dITP diphosphohydrolase
MKKQFVFATNNKHKLEEISSILGDQIKLLSLSDIGCFDEIPEDHDTLESNAEQKAFYIYNKYHLDCFADDTGLEVEALNGRPGVYSARYSEDEAPEINKESRSEANIKKLLREMNGKLDRTAQFRTVICLIEGGKNYFFEGKIKGQVIDKKKGISGFGYDPVFIPDNYLLTFAELNLEEKNKVSHRAKAIAKLVEHFNIIDFVI